MYPNEFLTTFLYCERAYETNIRFAICEGKKKTFNMTSLIKGRNLAIRVEPENKTTF